MVPVATFELQPRHHRFTDFQSRPCISSRPTACRPIRRSILSFPEIRVSRYSVLEGCSSLSLSLYPIERRMYRLRLARARSLHTRETRCYHVCLNNSVRAFDSSMFPAAWRERRQEKKRFLGLRYLPIVVTSAPNCTPKPEALPRSHPSPFAPSPPHPSFLFSSCHVDLDFVSPCRILHPTDHSYESYLVAFSARTK